MSFLDTCVDRTKNIVIGAIALGTASILPTIVVSIVYDCEYKNAINILKLSALIGAGTGLLSTPHTTSVSSSHRYNVKHFCRQAVRITRSSFNDMLEFGFAGGICGTMPGLCGQFVFGSRQFGLFRVCCVTGIVGAAGATIHGLVCNLKSIDAGIEN